MNKKNKVTASKFIDWYFSDKDGTLSIGGFLIEVLKEKGRFSMTAKDVFDLCGYVPAWICEDYANPKLLPHFYDAEEVEFIDDLNP